MPGVDRNDGMNHWRAVIQDFLKRYTDVNSKRRKDTLHHVLGYALKVKENIDPPSTFSPTSVKLQTMDYKPTLQDPLPSDQRKDNSAFCLAEMTGKNDMPARDLQWTGNWFSGSIQGTLVLNNKIFHDQFLLPTLQFINQECLKLMNDAYYFIGAPERKDHPWILDDKKLPDAKDLCWEKVHRYLTMFQWSNRWDTNRGKVNHHYCDSKLSNVVNWHAGSGWISIETYIRVQQAVVELNVGTVFLDALLGSRDISPDAVSDRKTSTATIRWTTNIIFDSVENGNLSASVVQSQPIVETSISQQQSNIFQRLYNNPAERNAALANEVRDVITQKVKDVGLVAKIEKGLNQSNKFVFPGGGTFKMKDPTFTVSGDLLVGLTTIVDHNERAIVPDIPNGPKPYQPYVMVLDNEK